MANVNQRRAREAREAKKKKLQKILIFSGIGLAVVLGIAAIIIFSPPKDQGHSHDHSHEGHEHIENTAIKEAAEYPYLAEITMKDGGTIKIGLDEEKAPITVKNFVDLAKDGFYDGLTFHRIISGFMMQGGDPDGDGIGGSEKTIKGEFSSNGVENDLSHTRGAVSMARLGNDMDSASSQFFIVHEDSTFLDGDYACFGYVLEGMEVVDEVCAHAKTTDNNGSVAKADQPIIESVKIIEQ